ncbi:MAG: S8 family serine peptidase [Gammaproteobacteria bacterium]|nr:S8 family serine peptidase [Gammaproteobacteria bacterium]
MRMRNLFIFLILLCYVFLAGCTHPLAKPPLNAQEFQRNATTQILVNLPDADADELEDVIRSMAYEYSLIQVTDWPIIMLGIHCYVFEVKNNVSPGLIVSRLQLDPRVESAQPMNTFEVMATKREALPLKPHPSLKLHYDDPYLKLQHGIRSSHVERAHEYSTGKGVNVAVIDSGVDIDHLDLRGRIIKNKNFVSANESHRDIHGTAIAGVIAAVAGNQEGIIGIAPDVNIMALKACWQKKQGNVEAVCSSFTLAKAINFALKEKAHVINMSLSGPEDPLLTRLIQRALDLGVVVVAAKNDKNPEYTFPVSVPGVIGVSEDKLDPAKRDTIIPAPGKDILTTVPRDSYDFLSGNSLAAAHVTGVVSLLLEQRPQLSQHRIQQLLHKAVRIDNSDLAPEKGMAVVNACEAITSLLKLADCR